MIYLLACTACSLDPTLDDRRQPRSWVVLNEVELPAKWQPSPRRVCSCVEFQAVQGHIKAVNILQITVSKMWHDCTTKGKGC